MELSLRRSKYSLPVQWHVCKALAGLSGESPDNDRSRYGSPHRKVAQSGRRRKARNTSGRRSQYVEVETRPRGGQPLFLRRRCEAILPDRGRARDPEERCRPAGRAEGAGETVESQWRPRQCAPTSLPRSEPFRWYPLRGGSANQPHSLNPQMWHFMQPSAISSWLWQSGQVPMKVSLAS